MRVDAIATGLNKDEFFLDGWHVEVAAGRITRGRRTAHLEPQVMKVLTFLASHHNEVVGKDRLIAANWGRSFVSDAALTRCIFEIRRAFGDNAEQSRIVETIPKVGYRLVATMQATDRKRRFGRPILLWSSVSVAVVAVFLLWGMPAIDSNLRHVTATGPLTSISLADEAYQNGVTHYEKFSYFNNENAIALFEKALAYDPSFGLAYARLSDSLTQKIRYWGGDRLADARLAASKALELAPLQPQSHNALGSVLELSGQGGDALASYRRAYTLDPTHWQSAYNAAALHKIRLEFKDAETLFLQTLKYSPENLSAMGHLGFLHLRMGNIDVARQWLGKAIEQAPLEPYAWSQMAALEMVVGNTTEAIENCQKVRDFYPTHQPCLHVLGSSYLLNGNVAEAQAWFDYATVNLTNSSYAQLGNAQVLFASGEVEQGMTIVNQVLERSFGDIPESADPWAEYWIIAASYALKGDKSNAYVWLEKAAESGRRFYLWDRTDPLFSSLQGDRRFDRYIAMTKHYDP